MHQILIMVFMRFVLRSLVVVAFLVQSGIAAGQTDSLPAEDWDAYLTHFKKYPGSITLNMALKKVAPVNNLAYVVITGVKYSDCQQDGFPSRREFANLYKISDSVNAVISRSARAVNAGSFTFQCERLEYFYTDDTTWIRHRLRLLYESRFPGYTPYTEIKKDSAWSTYNKFLYPKEETLEIMANQKIVTALQKAGDNPLIARNIDHWAYFKTEADRNCFINTYLAKNRFTVTAKESNASYPDYPFKVMFSRTDKPAVASISKLTFTLRRQAALCLGVYDGWETTVQVR